MESNAKQKNTGVIVYVIISVIVIIALALLLIFTKKCKNSETFSNYCTLGQDCNLQPTPGLYSCKCPGTFNGLNVLRSISDKRGDNCSGNNPWECGQNLDCEDGKCNVQNCAKDGTNKINFQHPTMACDTSKLYRTTPIENSNPCKVDPNVPNYDECNCIRERPDKKDMKLYFSGTL